MRYQDIQGEAEDRNLSVLGGFHPRPSDLALENCETLLLLGPKEPDFWPIFKTEPEWHDGDSNPMDRWSMRVIGSWAESLSAQALYPFGGPPFLPFFTWAKRTGRIHASPIMLLVHDSAGLLVSFRGALALKDKIELPSPPANPCDGCATQPCRTGCPVSALDGSSYDVQACKSYLDTPEGQACMSSGCAARRICPVSRRYPRIPEQSAYHMKIYKG